MLPQFPLWWHAQPPIMKGWFDRVLVFGGLYSGSKRYDNGHFAGKKAICSVTTGSPEKTFMPFGRAGNMVEWLWPIHSSLYYVGFDVLPPPVSSGAQGGGIPYPAEHQPAHRQLIFPHHRRQTPHCSTQAAWQSFLRSGLMTGTDQFQADAARRL